MLTMLNWIARDASIARDAARVAAAAASRAARLVAGSTSSPEAVAAASRAACSAAVAASRVARLAAAAASRAARSDSCISGLPRGEATQSKYPCDDPCHDSLPREPVPGLDITDEDLVSDEATWVLYENWCKVYNKERDHKDMTRRFPIFKAVARIIHKFEDARLGVFADGPDEEAGPERLRLMESVNKKIGIPFFKI